LKRELFRLARLYGIQTSYVDMAKQRQEADPETLLLVLRAVGAQMNGFEDVPGALRRRIEELRERRVEPVMIAWDGKLGGKKFEFGYHVVEMKGREVFVISAPVKAYFPFGKYKPHEVQTAQKNMPFDVAPEPFVFSRSRAWGIFAPVYALHSKRNPYAGDLTDFDELMDWLSALGGTVGATLPLLGAFLDEPFDASPYSPATRLFWNEFYIDIERIPEFAGRSLPEPRPRKTKLVDYKAVMAYKRRILEDLARQFFANAVPQRLESFVQFIRNNDGVEDYARFRAVMDHQRKPWTAWPNSLRGGSIKETDYDAHAKNYHLYSQWVIQEQLQSLSDRAASRGQLLYLDLPLGLSGTSYDVWRNRDFFVTGVAGGAPPDPVFTKGQNWGFPPMNPEAMRLNRYQYYIAFLRNHFRYAKLLRIDHVMGLYRLYWIPDTLTGDKGVYVTYPAEELWAILSVESHRYGAGIVGENLGTVPPAVNTAMSNHDIRQMYVVQYEIMGDPKRPTIRPPRAKSVASINTHDMPTFRAFLDGEDIDDRLDLGILSKAAATIEHKTRIKMKRALANLGRRYARGAAPKMGTYYGVLRFLSESMADIVLVNLEDLWEETLPQNVPTTSSERPNWRRHMKLRLDEIRKMSEMAKVLSNVFADRSRSVPVQ
jgi:4-alpha-glucanotransferase